jgi:pyruvate-ferredoxin/flavodoxin oxidoreductase
MAIKKTFLSVDGNTAAALASYNFTEVAGIYPITPSSNMAELVDVYASQGKINFFGNVCKVVECSLKAERPRRSRALQGGAFASSYTASQGLLLMVPNIYKWCGELLPAVCTSQRAASRRAPFLFLAITRTFTPSVRRVLPSCLRTAFRKSPTWLLWPI